MRHTWVICSLSSGEIVMNTRVESEFSSNINNAIMCVFPNPVPATTSVFRLIEAMAASSWSSLGISCPLVTLWTKRHSRSAMIWSDSSRLNRYRVRSLPLAESCNVANFCQRTSKLSFLIRSRSCWRVRGPTFIAISAESASRAKEWRNYQSRRELVRSSAQNSEIPIPLFLIGKSLF